MRAILKELLKNKRGRCISVIIPTELKSFDDKEKVNLTLKKAVNEVQEALKKDCSEKTAKHLRCSLNTLVKQIDLKHPQKGVGLFITDNFSKLIYFSFRVPYKVIISDSFEIKDILYNLDKLTEYNVLLLSKNHTRLFKGVGRNLTEIENNDFPQVFENEYEVNRAALHSMHNNEASKTNQSRLAAFFRKVDHLLESYLDQLPLILIGIDKYLSSYKEVGKHIRLILDVIPGNHDKESAHEISSLVWTVIEKYQTEKEKELLHAIEDKIQNKKAVSGIQEVWTVANEGRGHQLIVESNFESEGYINEAYNQLVFNPDQPNDFKKVDHVVEHMIEKVLSGHGSVNILEDGALKKYGRIVLTTRY
ncbi:MAG: hypothetical protein MI674_06785 [Cytophagales bacterium]|nr:hypothetical protein [Cytophagales bacterium]